MTRWAQRCSTVEDGKASRGAGVAARLHGRGGDEMQSARGGGGGGAGRGDRGWGKRGVKGDAACPQWGRGGDRARQGADAGCGVGFFRCR